MLFGKQILQKVFADNLRLVFVQIENTRHWLIPVFDEGQIGFLVAATQAFLSTTPGSNFTYTSDATWNNSSNTVECIGAGASGGGSASRQATGGGGGAYALISNFTFASPGTTTVTCRVGLKGSGVSGASGNDGGSTWFNSATDPGSGATNAKCGADGGTGGATGSGSGVNGGAGGASGSSWGQTKYSGGRGGNLTTSGTSACASGGGGAAGPNGAGSNGGDSGASNVSTAGGDAGAGSGGAGGAAGTNNGSAGTEFDATHGSGGGGGGNRLGNGGDGGNYGGGGGGASNSNTSGDGANGIIVLTWTPAASVSYTPFRRNFSYLRR